MLEVRSYFELSNAHCFVIAEVAQTHDGSLGQAYAFVDAVAQTGADAIKFQTHIASAESTLAEPFRVKFSRQDATRYQYWQRTAFSDSQWRDLAAYANSRGLHFLSSPFSEEAVDLLTPLVPIWKIGSGEVNNLPLLEAVCDTGKPILLSSGMSTWAELESSVAFLCRHNASFALMQATSMYPTPPEKLGLNLIQDLRQKFDCPVGLSDHSATIYPALSAFSLGARFVEAHITLSSWMFGPDVSSSLTVEAFTQMVHGIRFLETAFQNPINKDHLAGELSELRRTFRKSVVPRHALPAGKTLEPGDLTVKKPGTGIPAEAMSSLYGRQLKRAFAMDEMLTWDDVQAVPVVGGSPL